MLHPSQFKVDDAWIAFRLNDAAIETQAEGDFNCMALMDAASCFILGMEMYAARTAEPSPQVSCRLLRQAQSHHGKMPRQLFIAAEQTATALSREATRAGIEVVAVPESKLLVFIGEARDSFREQFGRAQ